MQDLPLKRVFTGLTLALVISSTQAAEVSGTVGFTNDYRFRGISQTSGDAAIQGSLDVAFENGAYAGMWGSNVDWGDDANIEIDYYVGFSNDISDDLSYDAFFAYYTYPGYESADGDYAEVSFTLLYSGLNDLGDIAATFAYSNDYFNSGDDSKYIALDYSYGVTENISLDLHAGHSFGAAWDGYGYEDYSIGLSGSLAGLDLAVNYLSNTLDVAKTNDSDDNTVVFSVSRSF
ncbi:conserved hypothetical protein [Neptunomonas qingdaonensis]|uniref:TIGR02001 family outer membrane protein n=1 Tax=Neptunomonas qingdaonensis TaxID=1045558 RepID=A0A1I2NC11_9GAMM|nr:conserved hypothetical protein [Neptunomonas qingdaonensis]